MEEISMNGRATWSTRVLQCAIAVLIACTGVVSHAQSTAFNLQNPSPSTAGLHDIQSVGSALFAVGGQNTLVKSLDNGVTWIQLHGDNNAMAAFRDLYFPLTGRGWAVGGYQRVRPADTVKAGVAEWTNDNGATWTREILQQATCINGITFTSATQGYAVGRGREAGDFFANEKAFVFITVDNGQTWTRQGTANGIANLPQTEFKSVAFANNSTGYMIGGAFGGGAGLRYTPDGTFLMATTNSGTSWWSSPAVGTPLPNGTTLSQVCPIDLTHAYMCGSVGNKAAIFYTSDNGNNWLLQTNGFPGVVNGSLGQLGNLYSMMFTSANIGYAVGYKWTGLDTTVLFYKTVNAGNIWTEVDPHVNLSQIDGRVFRMTASDDNHLFFAGRGDGGAVWTSADGGATWTQVSYNAAKFGGANPQLNDVSFASVASGWGVGFTNYVPGNLNIPNYIPGFTSLPVIVHSMDSGRTWVAEGPIGSFASLNGVAAISATEAWAGGADRNDNPSLWHTIDNGTTWNQVNAALNGITGTIYDIAFATPSNGYGVMTTSTNNYYTRNGGQTWNQATNVSGRHPTRIGTYFGATVWAVMATGLESSVDSGKTWTYIASTDNRFNSTNAYTFEGISFTPTNDYGWVTGWETPNGGGDIGGAKNGNGASAQAVVVVLPVPYIAFTTNGGATWAQQSYFRLPNPRYIPGVIPIPLTDSQWINDVRYQFNDVNDVIAFAPNAAIAVTSLNYTAINNAGGNWTNLAGGVGTRLLATTNGGGTWYEIDSSFQGTKYSRLSGTLTNRMDAFGVGEQGMIRHGYLRIPLMTTNGDTTAMGDTLFRHTVLSVNPTDSAYDSIKITNNAAIVTSAVDSAALTILGITFVNDLNDPSRPDTDYTLVSAPGSPLKGGESGYIVVKFKPGLFAQRFATMRVVTNSVTTPIRNVGLRGTGGLSVVSLSPSSLFVDTVAINGASDTGTIHICNPGVQGVHGLLEVSPFSPVSSWSSARAYVVGDVVLIGGQAYVCILAHVNHPPPNATFWAVFGGSILMDSTNTNSYSIIHTPTQPIPPGGCDSVVVTFRPTTGGQKRGSVTIATNARDYPRFVVSLGGVGGVRTFTADTLYASFADTVTCVGTATCFRIKNTGTLPLRIDSTRLDSAGKSEYTVTGLSGVVLAPGVDTPICVTHAPTKYGATMDSITVYSNAMNLPVAVLQLAGLGKREFLKLSTHTVMATVPCDQTFDTAVYVTDTGNIGMRLNPLPISQTLKWELGLPFHQDLAAGATDSIRIRHKVQSTHSIDTLLFVVTWNDNYKKLAACQDPLRYDTIMYIYDVCPLISVREEKLIATHFDLMQNFPNPFNPTTTIEYSIPSYSLVTLTVFNSLGQAVRVLENSIQAPGVYKSTFDASELPSGNYYYQLTAGSFTKRMMMTMTK